MVVSLRVKSLTYLIVKNDYEERVFLPGSDVYFTIFVISVLLEFSSLYAQDKSDLFGKK